MCRHPLVAVIASLALVILPFSFVIAGDRAASAIYLPMAISASPQEKYLAQNREFEQEVFRLINEQRIANRLPALVENAALTQAARRHAQDMATNHLTGHTGSDGTHSGDRMMQEGFTGAPVGEVVGGGDLTPQSKVQGWMDSPNHRALILAPDAVYFGSGYYFDAGWLYQRAWVVDIGKL